MLAFPTLPCLSLTDISLVPVAFVSVVASLALVTFGWILVTTIWDDVHSRMRERGRDSHARVGDTTL